MDKDCNFLVKLLDNREEIYFCEIISGERKKDLHKYYKNFVELCRDSPCEKTNHENCYLYKRKIERLDEIKI